MPETLQVIQAASNAIFLVLGLVSLRVWRRSRSVASRWVAGTFLSSGLVVAVSQFIPEDNPPTIVVKLLVLGILSMPVCLHMFVVTMDGIRPWTSRLLGAAVVLVAISGLLIPRFPGPGEPSTVPVSAFTLAFLALWAALTSRTSWRLFRASRHQPGVIRSRLIMLGAASVGLGFALVIPALSPDTAGFETAGAVFGAASGVLFLLGFIPPRLIRARWRESEDAE
ncbi:MAG: hypothetical protein ACI867_002573, partial [Glaciecola sp.]